MDAFLVRPGPPLSGTVAASGAKNSTLKLMAATLLADGRHVITNVPRIADVETMSDLLVSMGVDVARPGPAELTISVSGDVVPEAPYELVERMRASIVVLGPLLGRFGRATVALPGGDDFGARPIDMHLRALEAMGATFEMAHGDIRGAVPSGRLRGARIVLEFPSVGATENVLMAAVLADGVTVIENAAREPELADLAELLLEMGARVDGAGTSTITVEGVDVLRPATHAVIPDRLEVATFLVAVGLAGGDVTVAGARPEHMDMLFRKLGEMGLHLEAVDGGVRVARTDRLTAVDVSTLPYPGVATDYKPLVVALLSTADGVGIVTENVYGGNRFAYVAELNRMGADIRTEGHHAVVRGVERLSGAPVKAHDLRAGAALVLAGLAADGETLVAEAHHVDRGYDDLAAKLRGLGADVTRVRDREGSGDPRR